MLFGIDMYWQLEEWADLVQVGRFLPLPTLINLRLRARTFLCKASRASGYHCSTDSRVSVKVFKIEDVI